MVQEKFIFFSIRLKEACGREIQAIEQSCVCFVCPVVFIDSNGHTLCLSSSQTIENFVGGENGRSEEAASILGLQLCLQLLSNEKN